MCRVKLFHVVRLALFGLAVVGMSAITHAQSFSRPSGFNNETYYQPCGGYNFVQNTTDMSGVYTGKTGVGPQLNPVPLNVAGVPNPAPPTPEGNQTSTEFFGFSGGAGPFTSNPVLHYSISLSGANCAYFAADWTTATYGEQNQTGPIPISSACAYPNSCSVTLPQDTNLANLLTYVVVENGGGAQGNGQALIWDIWVSYTQ